MCQYVSNLGLNHTKHAPLPLPSERKHLDQHGSSHGGSSINTKEATVVPLEG